MKGSYSDVLPMLNAVLEVTPEMLLRLGPGQNLNRPGLGSMAARGNAFYNEDSDEITASRGNPDLRLYKDTTLDFSAEYYFGDVGVISASLFQKWIKNFIGSQTLENIPFSETGVPSSTIPGATDNSIAREFSMPMNVPGTKSVTGLELAAQGQFTFLPAPFDSLGMVANFTYVDASAFVNITEALQFSVNAINLTNEKETQFWGHNRYLYNQTQSGRT